MEENRLEKFYKGLEELGITLDGAQVEQFLLYHKMLLEWNEKMNLTTITEFDEVVEKHFLDSLCLVKIVPNLNAQSIIDIGTGAGFPGLPLKIAFPGLELVLIDSVGKKLTFLDAVIGELKLNGVMTVHGRAEGLARKDTFREQFDVCVSRAVADLPVLTEYSLPFVRVGGCFVAYKGANRDEESARAENVIALLGGKMEGVATYSLPCVRDERTLLCIRKVRHTSQAYPRKAGMPAKNPIL